MGSVVNKSFHTAVVMFCFWLASLLAIWNAAFVLNHLFSPRLPAVDAGVGLVTIISHGLFACVTLAVITARSAFHLCKKPEWERAASVYLAFLLAFASLPIYVLTQGLMCEQKRYRVLN